MAFFRTKKIKGKEYAYIVENEWKKGSRQKVKGYLGRIHRFELKNDITFQDYINKDIRYYIENNSIPDIILDLVKCELLRHAITKEDFFVDLINKTLQKNNRNVVFLINDGFMCGKTLKNLLEFKPEGDEHADGYKLAKSFVEAGIKIPQEVFVGLFGKLYKKQDESK